MKKNVASVLLPEQGPHPGVPIAFEHNLWAGMSVCLSYPDDGMLALFEYLPFNLCGHLQVTRPRFRENGEDSEQAQAFPNGKKLALIQQMSRENRLWGAERIRDTFALLGFAKLDVETVRKYMVGGGTLRQRSSSWLSFLRNHLQVSWAIDFFTVTTVGFGRLYVFVVLEHGRRRVVHWAISAGPSMAWVIQQLREATPFGPPTAISISG